MNAYRYVWNLQGFNKDTEEVECDIDLPQIANDDVIKIMNFGGANDIFDQADVSSDQLQQLIKLANILILNPNLDW